MFPSVADMHRWIAHCRKPVVFTLLAGWASAGIWRGKLVVVQHDSQTCWWWFKAASKIFLPFWRQVVAVQVDCLQHSTEFVKKTPCWMGHSSIWQENVVQHDSEALYIAADGCPNIISNIYSFPGENRLWKYRWIAVEHLFWGGL